MTTFYNSGFQLRVLVPSDELNAASQKSPTDMNKILPISSSVLPSKTHKS